MNVVTAATGESTSLPDANNELFALLAELGITTSTHEHSPVYTVAESTSIKAALPGAHSKNLFLKDRKGRLFLVTAKDDTSIDLKRLHEAVGASGRFSFGSAELLGEVLGIEPGSVTPFAAINDRAERVTVVIDAALMTHEVGNFHPLVNTRTTSIAMPDLLRFLRATGHEPVVVALPSPAG